MYIGFIEITEEYLAGQISISVPFCMQLSDIAEKDKLIAQLNEQLEFHEKTKRQVVDKAMRDIESLKKRLGDERKLKKIAIHKVDDLLSQVISLYS